MGTVPALLSRGTQIPDFEQRARFLAAKSRIKTLSGIQIGSGSMLVLG